MKNYVGIDLGTTNSAICSYNGGETRIWKSPEQNDVTPSALYMDRRGNKYVGKRAYDSAPHSPDNAATLFKRLMGSSTPIELPAVDITMTPEECSAEILRVLFGYLPEEVRNDSETGTVITVPAAFDQMQKNSTMQAAELADIGHVALMQEPVAAVMSVMRTRNSDGTFVVYDLGGGTLDVALAESIGGRVNLLAHGGISFCGGRDFDRFLVDNLVKPWLFENFDLPENFSSNPDFKSLLRLAGWAAERAKIELSARDETAIALSETEARTRDQSGQDIYIEIPLPRGTLDGMIEEKIQESVVAVRETLSKAGMNSHDIERVVFIGGPTNYKPLRDKVAFELGIPANTDINPMTAVAEGAALFAESIEWSSQKRTRKSNRGRISSADKLDITFNYTARTPEARAKIIVQAGNSVIEGTEFQIDSLDTGWSSGRLPLSNGASLDVSLAMNGENTFKVFVFDTTGGPVTLDQDKISIIRTAATVDAIPASHSIGVEVLENKLGGKPTIEWLVLAGDQLPKKGIQAFRAGESLKAGSEGSLNFKLLEGESEEPEDNRFIGALKITGSDFDDGVIPAGAELQCEFEMLDSGNIVLNVSVPSIAATFRSDQNFYSPQDGQLNFKAGADRVTEEGKRTLQRLDDIENVVDDARLEKARSDLEAAANLDPDDPDEERTREANEIVGKVRKLLSQIKKENLKEIRRMELDSAVEFFNEHVQQYARPSEERLFENLIRTAQRSLDRNDRDFEIHLNGLKGKNFEILWGQDWFVVQKFKWMASSPHYFSDSRRFEELVAAGMTHMRADKIDPLRQIVGELWKIQVTAGSDDDMLDMTNIIRG